MSDKTVHELLKKVIENKDKPALNYCVNYARAGLRMGGNELRVQILYVLSNMAYWRGEVAKEVRAGLKKYLHQQLKGE